jgi:transposase
MSDRKRQEWIARLKRFHEKPTSVQAFSRTEGISTASFYLWRRRLADEPREPTTQTFVPLTVTHTSPTASVEVAFPNGIVFRLPADEHSLRALFALAREASC